MPDSIALRKSPTLTGPDRAARQLQAQMVESFSYAISRLGPVAGDWPKTRRIHFQASHQRGVGVVAQALGVSDTGQEGRASRPSDHTGGSNFLHSR